VWLPLGTRPHGARLPPLDARPANARPPPPSSQLVRRRPARRSPIAASHPSRPSALARRCHPAQHSSVASQPPLVARPALARRRRHPARPTLVRRRLVEHVVCRTNQAGRRQSERGGRHGEEEGRCVSYRRQRTGRGQSRRCGDQGNTGFYACGRRAAGDEGVFANGPHRRECVLCACGKGLS
jgi:hypothetical protein